MIFITNAAKRAHPADCWPTPDELLLLRAALLPVAAAREAWDTWRGRARRPLSVGLLRLLPAARLNLGGCAEPDPWLELAQTEHVRAHGRNLLLLDDAAPLFRALHGAGIEFLLLKGGALVAAHYPDPGLRPMVDLDLLVRPAQVESALAVLEEQGYSPARPADPAARASVHSAPFTRPGAAPLDLHWRSFDGDADDDAAFWDGATPATVAGVAVRVPAPAELLLNACLQGLRFDWDAPQRWVLDAMAVLCTSAERLDWQRLIERASAQRGVCSARDALRFLHRAFAAPVPPQVQAALDAIPVPAWDRLADRSRRMRPDLRGPLLAWALRRDEHRRLLRRGAVPPGPTGLLDVWRRSWGLDHLYQLPAHALGRGARRLWQLARHRLRR